MREFPRGRSCSWVILGRLLPALLIWLGTSSQCLRAESLEQANGPPTPADPRSVQQLYGRDNLIAWCIVPFDSKKRGPEERAAMLQRLGFKHFAYDWRAEHIPTFDAEIEALKRHGVSLDAFWVAPGELNHESRLILDVLKRHRIKAQLWVLLDLGPDRVSGPEQERRVERRGGQAAAAGRRGGEDRLLAGALQPRRLVRRAGKPGRHHRAAEGQGVDNVGMVYNLHHGHDHLDRFPALLTAHETVPGGHQPERHGHRRRQGRPQDPSPGPGRA